MKERGWKSPTSKISRVTTAPSMRWRPVTGQRALSWLDHVRRMAQTDKEARFTALLRHVDVERLRAASFALRPKAASGVDGEAAGRRGPVSTASMSDLRKSTEWIRDICR
jgi:hypothetical protein